MSHPRSLLSLPLAAVLSVAVAGVLASAAPAQSTQPAKPVTTPPKPVTQPAQPPVITQDPKAQDPKAGPKTQDPAKTPVPVKVKSGAQDADAQAALDGALRPQGPPAPVGPPIKRVDLGVHPAPAMGAGAAALAAQVRTLTGELGTDREAIMGAEIMVNGKRLAPLNLLREIVYLTGGKLVEAKIPEYFVAEQIELSVAEGKDRSEFEITDGMIMEELDGMMAEFAKQYPGVPFWDVVQAQYGLTKDTFMDQRRQSEMFDKVFFPGRPADWPIVTQEAIFAETQGENGKVFMQQLTEATEGVDENGKPKEVPEFWLNMLRNFVTKQLKRWSDIQWGSHGLPPEMVIKVNNQTWSTNEAYDFVKQGVYSEDLQKAVREVVIRDVLRQELEKAGAYLSNEEFTAKFDEYRKPFDDTPFNMQLIAVRFKGYPCLEAFRARWRLVASYEKMISEQITDEALQAHADARRAFFADGQASIDFIPFQARDVSTGAWSEGGMAAAKARAQAAYARLESKEISFDKLRDEVGEYFALDEDKGKPGFKPLNQVRQAIRESEFSDLLNGGSIADYLFFEAPEGKSVGPLQGSDGYYIARVNARTPARRQVDVSIERDRTLVREDFINHGFLKWAGGVLDKAEIVTK